MLGSQNWWDYISNRRKHRFWVTLYLSSAYINSKNTFEPLSSDRVCKTKYINLEFKWGFFFQIRRQVDSKSVCRNCSQSQRPSPTPRIASTYTYSETFSLFVSLRRLRGGCQKGSEWPQRSSFRGYFANTLSCSEDGPPTDAPFDAVYNRRTVSTLEVGKRNRHLYYGRGLSIRQWGKVWSEKSRTVVRQLSYIARFLIFFSSSLRLRGHSEWFLLRT